LQGRERKEREGKTGEAIPQLLETTAVYNYGSCLSTERQMH